MTYYISLAAKILSLALAAAGPQAPAPAPTFDRCVTVIPASTPTSDDSAFFSWVDRFGYVSYDGPTNEWTSPTGLVIGWSVEEDSAICVLAMNDRAPQRPHRHL